MDIQLQELIEKIKKDGVSSAEAAARKIVADAEKKAASIVSDAEVKADSIIKTAKAETERMEKASEDAIAQAGRNLIISFRDGINKELSAIVNSETEKAMDKDLLKKLIPETVKAWSANPDADDVSVLLPAKDLKALETSLKTALKAKISKGLVIKSDASLSAGFRIGSKNGSAFYDFSAEEVAALFSAYLNPKTTEIMKKAAAGIAEEEPKPAVAEEKKPAASKAKKTAAKPAAKSRAKTTKETK
ncbi:MAG: V-type ATP synthase subunit E [Spirochaetales bacterium]|nr:V-type ATP synthase subunit E [Spirochaetales bacterium]